MAGNQKKVQRYYKRFQDATEDLNGYLMEVGGALEEGGYVSTATEFVDDLEHKTDAREAARLQLERVVREEEVSVGPITIENRCTISYDGKYLWDLLADEPDKRDEVVEVVYKVKATALNRMATNGEIPLKDIKKAIVSQKRTVALKGMPHKVGLG